jgi:hypothetical protein
MTQGRFPLFHTLSLAVLAIGSRVLMAHLETMVTGWTPPVLVTSCPH